LFEITLTPSITSFACASSHEESLFNIVAFFLTTAIIGSSVSKLIPIEFAVVVLKSL